MNAQGCTHYFIVIKKGWIVVSRIFLAISWLPDFMGGRDKTAMTYWPMKSRPWLSVRKPLRWEWVLTPLLCLVIRRQQSYTVSQTYIRRNRYIISNIQIKIHVFICKYRTETSSVCSFMLMICSLQTTGRPSWIRNSVSAPSADADGNLQSYQICK